MLWFRYLDWLATGNSNLQGSKCLGLVHWLGYLDWLAMGNIDLQASRYLGSGNLAKVPRLAGDGPMAIYRGLCTPSIPSVS